MTPYSRATDQYLAQKVMGASPEQLVAMLLEAGQRYLLKTVQAMGRRDCPGQAQATDRVFAILQELTLRLNREEGGELATNLLRTYEWWGRELMQANMKRQPERLDRISEQMGDLKQTWEQLHQMKVGAAQAQTPFLTGALAG